MIVAALAGGGIPRLHGGGQDSAEAVDGSPADQPAEYHRAGGTGSEEVVEPGGPHSVADHGAHLLEHRQVRNPVHPLGQRGEVIQRTRIDPLSRLAQTTHLGMQQQQRRAGRGHRREAIRQLPNGPLHLSEPSLLQA